ncbi:MAG: group 1 glycosyl transferase [Pseudomonadales bacterium]|nr:group 1 glycosyl transferase [Pseudomonadales bacterium]|tara:strand:- start:3307 stop:4419 length:1113 start_codon:yes stop_codon:yes gene_type:complete
MKIVFLCKRRYMNKDVIMDRYARLYEMPRKLAQLGHQVECFSFSYQSVSDSGTWPHQVDNGRLVWHSRFGKGLLPVRLMRHLLELDAFLRDFQPDVVIAASDIPNVVLGRVMAHRHGARFVADLYDNFESFPQSKIPGFCSVFRWAVRRADVVTCVSPTLMGLVKDSYRVTGKVLFLPSTIDDAVFTRLDKTLAREKLGLPGGAKLIGTAGALYREKGIADLYGAWDCLKYDEDLHLVLAGPQNGSISIPDGERVHYLGSIDHKQVATLFNALDVGVMCIPDDRFGQYCFPQKAYEMLACGLPVVSSKVGAMAALLEETPNTLYEFGDSVALAGSIASQLLEKQLPDISIKDWTEVIAEAELEIRKLLES